MLFRYSHSGSSFSSRFCLSSDGALLRHTAICTLHVPALDMACMPIQYSNRDSFSGWDAFRETCPVFSAHKHN